MAGKLRKVSHGSNKIRVAWLAPYPSGLLHKELRIVRSSKAHPASWVVNLANAFSRREDVDLHIITATSGIRESATVKNGHITFHVIRHTFPFTSRGHPKYLRLDLLSRYWQLRRGIKEILAELEPDVIHVHGTEYGYGLAALEIDAPTIISIQGIVSAIAEVSPSLSFRLQARIERTVIRNARYFGTRTAWANAFVLELNSAATIYELPEAINRSFFEAAVGQSNPNILMVGTVVQRKGIEEALHAMKIVVTACPSAKLRIIGGADPKYLRKLKAFTRSAGIESNVEWLGSRSTDDVMRLHADSAILIHPSHVDNSPNSVAEAMVSGLPVVATAVGGILSMIEHGATGLLVEPRNNSQLAAAVISLLENENERVRLARQARVVALERHFPPRVAERTVDAYRDILAKKERALVEEPDWGILGNSPAPEIH
jgi:glycosyltransferase involved in cell wall biosynthesis